MPFNLKPASRSEANSASQLFASDLCTPRKANGGLHHVHMAWILAADTKGNPRPRMYWLID